MSCVSDTSTSSMSPRNSNRSMDSSQHLADGRPEVTIATKLPRAKSIVLKKRKSKSVTPVHGGAAMTGSAEDEEEDEGLITVNTAVSFDFLSLFQRAKSTPSMLQRQRTNSTSEGSRRRLRCHEELCLVMPKQSGKGGNSRKAWFMSSGLIGRDSGENVTVVTKDSSMDPVHAEISVDGDDYLLRDLNSSSGTYLCLSTTNRHHPQRDGYRLRQGDTVILGFGAKLIVDELSVGPKPVSESGHKHSLQAKLDRRLTDQMALERNASQVFPRQNSEVLTLMPSIPSTSPTLTKSVRFAAILDAEKHDPSAVQMLQSEDGLDYPVGSRYKRRVRRPHSPVYKELAPVALAVTITTPELPDDRLTLSLAPKLCYTIGSSPWCDIQVVSDGIYAVHARIVFDGHFFVLQDLSFEENPKRKTRVLLTRATRIGRGDWLLLGKCALSVVNVYRAFRDHEPDLKEVAFKCQLLRPSKRKSRRRDKYLPVAFKHSRADTFVIGKGGVCDGQVYTASLCVEQFLFQLDRGQCSLTPRFAGINQGMYFLLGRNSILHESRFKDDVIRYTSKALMLVEGSIFKIGSSELEVTYVKLEDTVEAVTRGDEIRENTQLLKAMPWLQQISFDRHSMENVARRAQRLELEAGDSVYDEGDPASFLFVVVSGDVELTWSSKAARRGGASSTSPSSLTGRQGSGGSMTAMLENASKGPSGEKELLVETVSSGSYFGEASLGATEMEYPESAKAATACQLLVLSREDICGYFSYYMDIIRPHLSYESHMDLLQKMRLCIPFCRSISYQELRVIASKAERLYYQQDDWILKKGDFLHKEKKRYGVLLIRYGTVDVVSDDGTPIFVPTTSALDAGPVENDPDEAVESELDASEQKESISQMTAREERLVWSIEDALLVLPDSPASSQNLKARTGVQCFYIDVSAFKHLLKENETRDNDHDLTFKKAAASGTPPPVLRRRSTNRRSSYATQFKARHSQVFTTALRANNADENDNLLENADLEDGTDPSRKWRRKKRNRNLLEKTILETQQNPELLNALVLYVLSGANRGDIHVVRNVATIGGLISGADIELNGRYVSPQQAVIEHREGRYWLYDTFSEWGTYVRLEENQTVQIYPGDVFLAGEVEFTCMGAFPERKKTSLCCIQ